MQEYLQTNGGRPHNMSQNIQIYEGCKKRTTCRAAQLIEGIESRTGCSDPGRHKLPCLSGQPPWRLGTYGLRDLSHPWQLGFGSHIWRFPGNSQKTNYSILPSLVAPHLWKPPYLCKTHQLSMLPATGMRSTVKLRVCDASFFIRSTYLSQMVPAPWMSCNFEVVLKCVGYACKQVEHPGFRYVPQTTNGAEEGSSGNRRAMHFRPAPRTTVPERSRVSGTP